MIWQIDFWLLLILIVTSLIALQVLDLLAAVVALSAFSFFVALLFAQMGALDVAFIEATLGAGVTGVLFIIAIFHTKRRTED
ncbi:MAG: hydrogenase subunit MbhD domain-containing protein [Chloroflexota bacterium]